MPLSQQQITQTINDAANNYGVPPNLLLKMLTQESTLNPNVGTHTVVINGKTHTVGGIAQFLDDTAKSYGVDPSDTSDQSVIAQIGAVAHLLADNAKQFNGGKLPSISEQEPWLKAAAAYNTSPDNVQKAIDQAHKGGLTDTLGILHSAGVPWVKSGDWTDYLPDETKQYVNIMKGQGGSTSSATDWASNYAHSKGLVPKTGSPPVSSNGELLPPNRADFTTADPTTGQTTTDEASYQKAWSVYLENEDKKRQLQLGPLHQYADDVINDISNQISAGKLNVDKASTMLNNRLNAFKSANDVYASNTFSSGLPTGVDTIPGTNIKIPQSALTPMNPLQQALDQVNQGDNLLGGINVPQVPNLQSILAGYGGQYGGQAGSAYTPPTQPPPSPPPAPNLLQQAVQSQATTGQEQIMANQQQGSYSQPQSAVTNRPTSNTNASDISALAAILARQTAQLGVGQ